MAEKKKPMGDDPLAWLGEGEPEAEVKKAPVKRARTRRTKQDKTAKVNTETELLEQSFAALAPQGEALAARFYQRLFDNYPEVKPLFKGIAIEGQQKSY